LNNDHSTISKYIYTYACRPEELTLCQMEMRALFGKETEVPILQSPVKVDHSRSPFIKERIDVLFEGETLEGIFKQVNQLQLKEDTFKVYFVKINDLDESEKVPFAKRREIERAIGLQMNGEADLDHPDITFGIVPLDGRWYFGKYRESESVWWHHIKKPREYSTALSTRVARAIVNIAVPDPEGIQVIDPCCGIGTVLVEALSMGIPIVGRDINPIAIDGSKENIAFFGYDCDVVTCPISEINQQYDVAIIDMPYNLLTRATPEEQQSILEHARRIATKLIVVTSEDMDEMIHKAGFEIKDRCVTSKSLFTRHVLLCE
jgi:tRNA G10  N-methylase Trm11